MFSPVFPFSLSCLWLPPPGSASPLGLGWAIPSPPSPLSAAAKLGASWAIWSPLDSVHGGALVMAEALDTFSKHCFSGRHGFSRIATCSETAHALLLLCVCFSSRFCWAFSSSWSRCSSSSPCSFQSKFHIKLFNRVSVLNRCHCMYSICKKKTIMCFFSLLASVPVTCLRFSPVFQFG